MLTLEADDGVDRPVLQCSAIIHKIQRRPLHHATKRMCSVCAAQ